MTSLLEHSSWSIPVIFSGVIVVFIEGMSSASREVSMSMDLSVCPEENKDCLVFYQPQLCAGGHRDMNYLYVCRNLLISGFHLSDTQPKRLLSWSGGILHDPPEDLKPKLVHLLENCLFDTGATGRYKAFTDLRDLLKPTGGKVTWPRKRNWISSVCYFKKVLLLLYVKVSKNRSNCNTHEPLSQTAVKMSDWLTSKYCSVLSQGCTSEHGTRIMFYLFKLLMHQTHVAVSYHYSYLYYLTSWHLGKFSSKFYIFSSWIIFIQKNLTHWLKLCTNSASNFSKFVLFCEEFSHKISGYGKSWHFLA